MAVTVSPGIALMIRAVESGGVTASGAVVVPPNREEWAREVLKNATPEEMAELDKAIAAVLRG
jgi:hypothetical protein